MGIVVYFIGISAAIWIISLILSFLWKCAKKEITRNTIIFSIIIAGIIRFLASFIFTTDLSEVILIVIAIPLVIWIRLSGKKFKPKKIKREKKITKQSEKQLKIQIKKQPKKYIVKLINLIKRYLPDIIIIIGAWILSYNIFRPLEKRGGIRLPSSYLSGYTDYHTEWKVLGIILLIIGIDIAIRRYIIYKKKTVVYKASQQKEKEEGKEKILEMFNQSSKITNNDVEKLLEVSDATATRYLDDLEKQGKIKQVGKTGKHVYYELV